MAKQRITSPTKKHLARAERERIQRLWIVGGTFATAVFVVGLLFIGWASLNLTPVATVNGEKITAAAFRGQVRLAQLELLNQIAFYQQFSGGQLNEQVEQLRAQLQDTTGLGGQVLDQMIRDVLIQQEANRRGISVTVEEVNLAIAEAYGFFADGTPTPQPTRTPFPTVPTGTPTEGPSPTPTPTLTVTPTSTSTPTATSGPTPTITPTSTPVPTPTAYTREGYEEQLRTNLNDLRRNYQVQESEFRAQFEASLYRERLYELFKTDVPREEEQAHARHILLADEQTAQEVLGKLRAGEATWEELAAEYSTDESNKESGGELGWFGRGRMVAEFEDAVFSAPIGEITGPVQTSFGWHLIEVLGREKRLLDDAEYQSALEQAQQEAFDGWLTQARASADVQEAANWADRVPSPPNLESVLGGQ